MTPGIVLSQGQLSGVLRGLCAYRHPWSRGVMPKSHPRQPQCKTFTVPEAADELGISAWCYYQAVKRGELPAIRVGHRLLVPRAHLDRLLGLRS